jgi:hypothetical protein
MLRFKVKFKATFQTKFCVQRLLLLFETKVQGKDLVVRFKDKLRYNVLK